VQVLPDSVVERLPGQLLTVEQQLLLLTTVFFEQRQQQMQQQQQRTTTNSSATATAAAHPTAAPGVTTPRSPQPGVAAHALQIN
jgi:hypothetical protein